MKVIQPNCRTQFSPQDIDFIVSVLSVEESRKESLVKLFSDIDFLNVIMDDEVILRALLERQGCLEVSKYFYFYVLVRHVLRRAGIDDRNLADYVAAVLAEFSKASQGERHLGNLKLSTDYLFEMLTALQKADESHRFLIHLHVGNHSLFISGVFPDHLRHRAQFRGAPEIGYYEDLGRKNFEMASNHRLAQEFDLAPILGMLSERFKAVRLALNDMSERLLSLGEQDYSLETLLRQNTTEKPPLS